MKEGTVFIELSARRRRGVNNGQSALPNSQDLSALLNRSRRLTPQSAPFGSHRRELGDCTTSDSKHALLEEMKELTVF